MRRKIVTRLAQIGKENYTAPSPLSGITTNDMLTRPCCSMSPSTFKNLNTPHPRKKKTYPLYTRTTDFWERPTKNQTTRCIKTTRQTAEKRVQRVVGTFLYYARAVDATILNALINIAAQQTSATENTRKRCDTLLDYLATYLLAKN